MYLVHDIRRFLLKLGIDVSLDQIRKLEKKGLITCTRAKNRYRVYSEQDFKHAVKNIILYYLRTPVEDILLNDSAVIKDRVSKILLAVKRLQ